MTGFFIALLSGALMSVQGVFNTQVTKTTGMWVSNAWVQLSAFAICLVMWLIMGRDSIATIGEVQPKYMLLGGVIGAGITWTVIKSMAQLGPAKAALLIVMSQLIVAYLIELVGLLVWKRAFPGESDRYGDRSDRHDNFSVEIGCLLEKNSLQ